MAKGKFTKRDLELMFANPFYCININPNMCEPHPTLVNEADWIKAALVSINELGAEKFLTNLLDNLKGKYVK